MEPTRRAATDSDRSFARTAHHVAYRDVVVRQFGAWDEDLQDQFFAVEWAGGGFEILFIGGEPCGYLAVTEAEEHVTVRELVLLPGFQGRGIGSSLLRAIQHRASSRGLPVRLGVLHLNEAVRLYERLGFARCGRTDTHTLMEWRADRAPA